MSAPKPKVLMLTQYLQLGGLERMVFNLSTALRSAGEWEPQVFVFDRLPEAGPENDLRPAFAKAGIRVTTFQKPPGFSVGLVLALRRTLSRENIRVLHTHDLGPLIYGVCAKLLSFGRVRLVHTQHSFVHLSRRWIYQYYERIFVRFADEIAVVSLDTRQSYVDLGVAAERIRVVPNGVRFPERGPADKARSREDLLAGLDAPARSELAPHLKSRWILYLARIHRTKGQDHALELWERLSPAVRGRSVLLFVGPESDPGQLQRLKSDIAATPDSARIFCAGATHVPELWSCACDLALSCSEFEGMPLGPIEAAGAGLPLVLSDIPGHEAVKAWSRQYPLADPAAGALLVENVLDEIERGPEDFFRRTWEKAGELRSRYTLARMSDAYARLYSES
ncbi:MAG: glycosyltransferase family 4 protein [Elusimicrobiota bacterium]